MLNNDGWSEERGSTKEEERSVDKPGDAAGVMGETGVMLNVCWPSKLLWGLLKVY